MEFDWHYGDCNSQFNNSEYIDPNCPEDRKEVPRENRNEAYYLICIAVIGLLLNMTVLLFIGFQKRLRRMTSGLLIHCCVLDILKCAYCIPFAHSLLTNDRPSFCTLIGGSYVIVVTASGFNIVAMICCEAYSFAEHNVGRDGHGSLSCVIFGIVMVYIGSLILHMGPTIIGGNFNYNALIGNCIFVYGTIKSYVVHAMWIAIMTLAMIGAVYYLVFFYRHVQANSTHRITSLVRASVAISRGTRQEPQLIRKIVRDSLSRARTLIILTICFIICWYPLFILTLIDPKFTEPKKVYKLLTFIAWSNAAVNPIVLILFDRNLGICYRLCNTNNRLCCRISEREICTGADTPLMLLTNRVPPEPRRSTLPRTPSPSFQRSCPLCHEGYTDHEHHCNGGVRRGNDNQNEELAQVHVHTVTTC